MAKVEHAVASFEGDIERKTGRSRRVVSKRPEVTMRCSAIASRLSDPSEIDDERLALLREAYDKGL